jgi:serine protease Do
MVERKKKKSKNRSMMNKLIGTLIISILILGTITNWVFSLQESSRLNDTEAEIAALKDNVPILENGISTLEGNLSAVEGDVSAVKGDVSTLEGSLTTVEGDVSAVKGDVSTLEGNLSAVEGDVSAVKGDVSTLEGNLSAVEGDVSTLESELLEIDSHSLQEVVTIIEPSVVRIETNIGSGSGVIITNTGWVLTNYHVLEGANSNSIDIILANGGTYDSVTPYIEHDFLDLALLKIDSTRTDFPEAGLDLPAEIVAGDGAVAIGYPLWPELSGQATFTNGIVSAIRSFYEDGKTNEYIQTNAAINPGNSGGPLVNLKGEVIGINTWGIRNYDGEIWEGLGFAIPIDDAKSFIEEVTR